MVGLWKTAKHMAVLDDFCSTGRLLCGIECQVLPQFFFLKKQNPDYILSDF